MPGPAGSSLTRIAIVNRGEAAMRAIRAVRELNNERGGGLRTIALHTPAERHAMFVREADEAVAIGRPGATTIPYLDHGELERALVASRADAAWVGWGFVAEDPAFSDLCARLGVVFVGPPGDVMRRLGSKIGAKQLAERVGVPVAPWSGGPVETVDAAVAAADRIGYPLVIKAAAGGGGRGIRMVSSAPELPPAFERARAEALRSFGDATVFLERRVEQARHVEVQVIADGHGGVWALGVRDCSIQRRNQKLLEESSSVALTAEQEDRIKAAAVELARASGYRNAGTVEFLYEPREQSFAFLEVNARLQVEHPVTEVTTGADLVKLQLHVASGGRLDGDAPSARGHAIEARLNAEDPERDFAPAPGSVELLRFPTGPGIRVDTGIAERDVIPPEFDSMVAKLIAWGRDRGEAIARLRRALEETTIVIRGGTTNKAFLLELLERPEVLDGTADTGWLDRVTAAGGYAPTRHADVALLTAAIDAYDLEEEIEVGLFFAAAGRGRQQARDEVGRTVELLHRRQTYRLGVARTGAGRYCVGVDGRLVDVEVDRVGRFESRVSVGGRTFRTVSAVHGADYLIEVDGVAHRVEREEEGVVRAPAPALVVAVDVAVGDEVEADARLAVLESMKMETAVTAPYAGRVREILAPSGAKVDAGAPLLRLDARAEDQQAAPAAPRVEFDLAAPAAEDGSGALTREHLTRLRSLLLGFDVAAAEARELARAVAAARGDGSTDPELLRGELELLTVFADVSELARDRPADEDLEDEQVHVPRELFRAYLHSLDVEREGLPDAFRAKLLRALRHYGVHDLEPSPELREASYRIFLAHQRAPFQVRAVRSLLYRRLRGSEERPEALRDELHETLDRVVAAAQLRNPEIGELARSVRFRRFDRPLIEEAHERAYALARERLEGLVAHPDVPDSARRIQELAADPEPLLRLLAERADGGSSAAAALLESIVRGFYDLRGPDGVHAAGENGRPLLTAELERGSERLVAALADASQLGPAAAEAAAVARAARDGEPTVVDLYVASGEAVSPDELATEAARALDEADFPAAVTRVAVVAGAGAGAATFRRGDDGRFEEDRVVRGLHPAVARRLRVWTLAGFVVSRLPAAQGVYLFRCVSEDDAADERLVALAEVSGVTSVRDTAGRVTALPEVEHVLDAALDGIRRYLAQRPPGRRPHANRLLLGVRPPVDTSRDELLDIARTLAPMTAGLGLEDAVIQARVAGPGPGETEEIVARFNYQPGAGITVGEGDPAADALRPLGEYDRKVLQARRRGAVYPYELVPLLTRSEGSFQEYDLDEEGVLAPVTRPPGGNRAGIVVGLVETPTERHPEGMARVALLGDPTRALGAIAEPEARRILGALDLAARLRVPIEWFAVSAGAKISMDSGTENMDWVARVLRALVEFTQAGGEVNVVVAGINVGAQPYWNAEATMLMHTRGILVMTPDSAMVLTGKQALDYSGGVSAEDNFGIGGYDRVMGPNGQSQYWAPDLAGACEVLFAHYEHTFVAPGERFPRRVETSDPVDRDIRGYPQDVEGTDFRTVGEIFSAETNPERKKPFDIRTLMRATIDQDRPPLERWRGMADADTAAVFDAHLGGYPVTVIGIESRPIPRHRYPPADGPDHWTAGTLFPLASKKVARAINAASGNRPVVVLANLSGFDGSPESLRRLQLEYGAEIGRAVVNFSGPIVFCVVSRYHGGAFVVFSRALNDEMEVVAVEGSHASVIGGAPAAAVVFAREVDARTEADPRVRELAQKLSEGDGDAAALGAALADAKAEVRAEKLGEVAAEFDRVHDVGRAVRVGSIHAVVAPERLRAHLVDAVERGIRRTLEREPAGGRA